MELLKQAETAPASLVTEQPIFPWFALRTRSNFESLAAKALSHKGYITYLPTYQCRRRWSDRITVLDMPLFKSYVFCRFDPMQRMPVLSAHGVAGIISFGLKPAAIDESEILAVQTVLQSGLPTEPWPFLREGQRVQILCGSLSGLEGILIRKKSNLRLVLSVSMLQRSISVEIERDWVGVI